MIMTERNIVSIYGRIKKFFYNKNETGFEEWHNFDCGKRKHISPTITLSDGDKLNIKHNISAPHNIKVIDNKHIAIIINSMNGFVINIGDDVKFLGSRLEITCKRSPTINKRSITYVYQVKHLSRDEKEEYDRYCRHELLLYEDDLYY